MLEASNLSHSTWSRVWGLREKQRDNKRKSCTQKGSQWILCLKFILLPASMQFGNTDRSTSKEYYIVTDFFIWRYLWLKEHSSRFPSLNEITFIQFFLGKTSRLSYFSKAEQIKYYFDPSNQDKVTKAPTKKLSFFFLSKDSQAQRKFERLTLGTICN